MATATVVDHHCIIESETLFLVKRIMWNWPEVLLC